MRSFFSIVSIKTFSEELNSMKGTAGSSMSHLLNKTFVEEDAIIVFYMSALPHSVSKLMQLNNFLTNPASVNNLSSFPALF